MILFEAYLSLMLMMTPIDESWNYMNPHPFRMKSYIIMNWKREDFYFFIDGSWVLRKEVDNDSKIKAKARRAWHERQTEQIR